MTDNVALGDVCDFIRGVTFDKAVARQRPTADALPILRAGNIQDELNTDTDLLWVPSTLVSTEQLLRENDIVICMSSGSSEVVGKTAPAIADLKMSVGSFCGIIRPRDALQASILSFYFQSHSFKQHRDAMARGANIQNLRFSQLEEIQISIPNNYSRIAAELNKAEKLRRIHRHALRMSDEFLTAAFLKLFGDPITNERGWKTVALRLVTERLTDGEHINPTFVAKGMPIVMAEQVEDTGVNLNSCKLVSAQDFLKFVRKCEPNKDDILLVSRGATIGRTCVVNTREPFCLMGSVILIKPDTAVINSFFLAMQLKSDSFLAVLRMTSGASAQQAIYIAHLKDKTVIVPPLPLQQKFAEVVHRHERTRSAQQEALRQAVKSHSTATPVSRARTTPRV